MKWNSETEKYQEILPQKADFHVNMLNMCPQRNRVPTACSSSLWRAKEKKNSQPDLEIWKT